MTMVTHAEYLCKRCHVTCWVDVDLGPGIMAELSWQVGCQCLAVMAVVSASGEAGGWASAGKPDFCCGKADYDLFAPHH